MSEPTTCIPAVNASPASAPPSGARTIWNHCAANCGGRCALRFDIEADRVTGVGSCAAETPDGTPAPSLRIAGAACSLLGRKPAAPEMAAQTHGAARIGPLRALTWDEAIDIASSKLRDTIDRFGNDAVFISYGTNANCTTARPFNRLMNCLGGYLSRYNDYSSARRPPGPRNTAFGMKPDDGSSFEQAFSADLVMPSARTPLSPTTAAQTSAAMAAPGEARGHAHHCH